MMPALPVIAVRAHPGGFCRALPFVEQPEAFLRVIRTFLENPTAAVE
jgi:hypothetical protein